MTCRVYRITKLNQPFQAPRLDDLVTAVVRDGVDIGMVKVFLVKDDHAAHSLTKDLLRVFFDVADQIIETEKLGYAAVDHGVASARERRCKLGLVDAHEVD
jgi:hypothetical protein